MKRIQVHQVTALINIDLRGIDVQILNIRKYNKYIYWRSCWKKYLKLSIPKTL